MQLSNEGEDTSICLTCRKESMKDNYSSNWWNSCLIKWPLSWKRWRIASLHTVCTIVFHFFFLWADTRYVSSTDFSSFWVVMLQKNLLVYNQNTHFYSFVEVIILFYTDSWVPYHYLYHSCCTLGLVGSRSCWAAISDATHNLLHTCLLQLVSEL